MLKINFLDIGNKKTTKDHVVNTLSYKYPLTKTRIYNEIKKSSGVTFHALNKAVNQLMESNVLTKEGREYKLNYNWVYSLNKFSENALSRLKDSNGCLIHGVKDIKEEGNVTTLTFDNIADMDKYCKSLHEYYYSILKEDETVCIIYNHHWWHMLYPEQEYHINAANKRFYCIGTKDTPLDKAGINFKKKIGMHALHNPKASFRNVTVYGETVVELIVGTDLSKALDSFFTKTKTVDSLDIIKFKQILRKNGKIIVIVNKNKEIAEEIRKEVLRNFKRGR